MMVVVHTGPLASSLVNKYGCRAVTIAGTLVAAVGLACSVVAPSIEVHYLTVGIITGTPTFFFLYFFRVLAEIGPRYVVSLLV